MINKSLGFIGGGRVTKILLKGYKNAKITFDKIVIFDPNKDSLQKFKEIDANIITESIDFKSVSECDIVFLALHPPMLIETLTKIKDFIKKESIVVSLSPKITIEKISSALNGHSSIVRINPSATGIINQGVNPIAFSKTISNSSKETILEIISPLGKSPIVDESKIEAYAIINAMGSTYFWFQFDKLKELAIKFGMEESEAKEVITDMINGTVNTLFNSNIPKEEVMDLVPVKPIGEYEQTIKSYYDEKLNAIYEKIKP